MKSALTSSATHDHLCGGDPGDVLAVEQSGSFRGIYFVLMGHLSPIDGIGPAEIGLEDFTSA